jgi:hypothetical protein
VVGRKNGADTEKSEIQPGSTKEMNMRRDFQLNANAVATLATGSAVRRFGRLALAGALLSTLGLAAGVRQSSADVTTKSFSMFVNPANLSCLRKTGETPKVNATVTRGSLNDTLTLTLSGFKPGIQFDLFTIENSNQTSSGQKDPKFKGFGMAWYQSDIHVRSDGTGSVAIKTILLDQIFGFDDIKKLAPTSTFNVGFWFNDPKDAAPCGFQGFTPFNGEHKAGPLAFITRPHAGTNLGPLCTSPNTHVTPAKCNP